MDEFSPGTGTALSRRMRAKWERFYAASPVRDVRDLFHRLACTCEETLR